MTCQNFGNCKFLTCGFKVLNERIRKIEIERRKDVGQRRVGAL
jgi:hypothetical protein